MYNLLEKDEYAPYFSSYVKLVAEGNLTNILTKQLEETINLLQDISEEQAHFRYGPEKWSLKEVIGHMADTERVMGYRLLTIARSETTALPGFDENEFIQNASFNNQSVDELLQNLQAVRLSTIHLIKSLTTEDYIRRGVANNSETTVRALIVIIAGHELHHCNIIRERYFGDKAFPNS